MAWLGDFLQSAEDLLQDSVKLVGSAVGLGFDTAPALVFGLAVIVVLPVLLIGGMMLRAVAEGEPKTSSAKPLHAGTQNDPERDTSNLKQQASAFANAVFFVEQDADEARSGEAHRFVGDQMVMRIGRESDNELRLEHSTVHRYHAMVQRDFENGYMITDLADDSGNGVFVDGQRISHSRLSGGEEIALGKAVLRFEIVD